MKILVTGSRKWRDIKIIEKALSFYAHYDTRYDVELIHGDARGADRIAAIVARKWGWKITPVPADWDTHGKAAGPIRNRKMLDMEPDVVVGFPLPDSIGTFDCLNEAVARGYLPRVWDQHGNYSIQSQTLP